MSETGQPIPEEQGKDFIGESMEVKLRNGLTVSVTTPTLRWWFDFLIPKAKALQWANIPDDIRQRIVKEMKQGKLSQDTISAMPMSFLYVLLEVVVYHVKEDADWCKDNLDIGDFLAILNAFIQVSDPKRVMDFFGKISQQVPVFLLARMTKGV